MQSCSSSLKYPTSHGSYLKQVQYSSPYTHQQETYGHRRREPALSSTGKLSEWSREQSLIHKKLHPKIQKS